MWIPDHPSPLPLFQTARTATQQRSVRCCRSAGPASCATSTVRPGVGSVAVLRLVNGSVPVPARAVLADHRRRRVGSDRPHRSHDPRLQRPQAHDRHRVHQDRSGAGRRVLAGVPGRAAAPCRLALDVGVLWRRGGAGGGRNVLRVHDRGVLFGVAAGGCFALASVGVRPPRSRSTTGRPSPRRS